MSIHFQPDTPYESHVDGVRNDTDHGEAHFDRLYQPDQPTEFLSQSFTFEDGRTDLCRTGEHTRTSSFRTTTVTNRDYRSQRVLRLPRLEVVVALAGAVGRDTRAHRRTAHWYGSRPVRERALSRLPRVGAPTHACDGTTAPASESASRVVPRAPGGRCPAVGPVVGHGSGRAFRWWHPPPVRGSLEDLRTVLAGDRSLAYG